jgi:hypothetical protein
VLLRFIGRSGPSLLLGLLATSCASRVNLLSHRDACDTSASADGAPFDSTRARSLAGHYRLTVISDWEDERGRSARGLLILQPTDTLHQYYERALGRWYRRGNRPLWGWAELSRKHLMIPWTADPASRDVDHPGALLHSSGGMELGVWRGMDGSNVYLKVESVSPNGFAGTWSSDMGIVAMVKDGRRLPNPYGHFCAVRQR